MFRVLCRGKGDPTMTEMVEKTKSFHATIEKAADRGDGYFILSSSDVDRDNDVIEPSALKAAIQGMDKLVALWQHKADQPLGYWSDLEYKAGKIIGKLNVASTNLGRMVKELLDFGTPLGASVGFQGAGVYDEDRGGINWKTISLLETSVVSCPANASCMQIAKSFDVDLDAEGMLTEGTAKSGITAKASKSKQPVGLRTSKLQPQNSRGNHMSLSQKIEAKQAELVEARDVLVDLTSKQVEDSALEEHELAVDEATANVEKLTDDLARLKRSEEAIEKSVAKAKKPEAPMINNNPATRVKDSQKADLLIKSALVAFESHVRHRPIEQVIQDRYGDNDAIKAVAGITTKAAQNPAMSNVAGWARELTRESYGAFMDLLRPESVIPRLPLNRYEFDGSTKIKIPGRSSATPNLAGAFRAEGDPIRVGALALSSIELTPKSLGVIGTYTMELLDRSTPSIEAVIRDAMIQDTAMSLDAAFLSATAGSATTPAGIQTYATGGNTAASGGNTAADIIADIRGRLQAMTGKNMGRRPVFIMNPARWYGVSLATTAAGTPAFPEAAQGNLMGIPVVTSVTVPADVVYLIDAAEVAFAGGAPRFMGTEVATIHEESVQANVKPIVNNAAAPGVTANPVRSLYQTNSAALRAVWELDWTTMRPDGSVQTLTAVGW